MGARDVLSALPAVGALLESAEAAPLLASYPRERVVGALRECVAEARARLLAGDASVAAAEGALLAAAAERLAGRRRRGLRPVINATGVIVHTNLGRSVLAESAARAVYEVACSYSNLEADLEAGRRGSRQAHIEGCLREIVGAEAGAVFNNNAAAVMLSLAALAQGKEVIVSRGQLVEIGGSFRIPDVMAHSGCVLKEVGATNRTHLHDYERALGENTGAIFRAHPSNYRIVGFVSQPDARELAELAHRHGLPLIDDLGSGALLDFAALGVGTEPTVAESLAAGADLVTFSGDKLLGGPQCGIAVGRRDLIERMRKHPLARAVRVDKMTLAALAATLDLFVDPDAALREIPTLRLATEPAPAVRARAEELAQMIRERLPAGVAALTVVCDDSARIGGGSLPEQTLATAAVHLRPGGCCPVDELARRLRVGEPAVYPRIQDDALVLDCRTVFPEQVAAVAGAVAAALGPGQGCEPGEDLG